MPSYAITNIGSAAIYDPTSGAALGSFDHMDSIAINIDSKLTETYGGSSMYPMVNVAADRKPTIDVKGSVINLGAAYRILGATNTAASSGSTVQIPVIGETWTIPAGGTVTLNHTQSTVDTTITVLGAVDDATFTKVSSAPTVGQYSVSGATLTFNTSDAGKVVRVFYSYDTSTGNKITISSSAMPPVYTFKAYASTLQNMDDPAKTAYDIAFVIRSCQFIGTFAVSMERQKASSSSLNINILDPGAGYNPIEIRTTGKFN